MKHKEESPAKGIVLFVLLIIAFGVTYSLAAGKPLPVAFYAVPTTVLTMAVFAWPKAKNLIRSQVPEPLRLVLESELNRSGLNQIVVWYSQDGENAAFPRPIANGPRITLSKRVCEEWSTEALVWSAKSDSSASLVASRKIPMFVLPMSFVFVMGAGWSERIQNQVLGVALVLGWVLLLFASIVVISMREQFRADKAFTVTEADRRAAKEALSYPYFDQKEKKWALKWMYPRRELRTRARRLGITLERGYRADEPSPRSTATGQY